MPHPLTYEGICTGALAKVPEPLPEPAKGQAYAGDMPGRPLVGIADVADLLQVTRTRADQLSRTSDWPPAVELVLPIDAVAPDVIRGWLDAGGVVTTDSDELSALLADYACPLPHTPRLWRLTAILEWAERHGREIDLDMLPPDLADEWRACRAADAQRTADELRQAANDGKAPKRARLHAHTDAHRVNGAAASLHGTRWHVSTHCSRTHPDSPGSCTLQRAT